MLVGIHIFPNAHNAPFRCFDGYIGKQIRRKDLAFETEFLGCFRSEEISIIFKISRTAEALVVWMPHPLLR